MPDKTDIEWTDATWNPTRGCSRVSPGCGGPNHQGGCYAEKIAARFSGPGQAFEGYAERGPHGGRWSGKLGLVEDMLDLPLRWRKPRRIFVNSMSDLFHENLPDESIDQVFARMAMASQHTYQVLTKRADRMRAYMTDGQSAARRISKLVPATLIKWPLPQVWLGVSVEDQERADERIPDLLATPAAKRFLSCEPLLGPIDLEYPAGLWPNGSRMCCDGRECGCMGLPIDPPLISGIHWVIAGGESGPGARPMHPDWARSLRDQCQAAGVAFFFKQWGEWLPGENHLLQRPVEPAQWQDGETGQHSTCRDKLGRERPEGRSPEWRHFTTPGQPGAFTLRVGKKRSGAKLDGHEWREFPT